MDRPLGDTHRTAFRLNGDAVAADPTPGERLSETLRERLGARDVKVGCNAGDCGACTVLVDGLPVCACLVPTARVAGQTIETAAGLVADDPDGRRLATAFEAHGAAQCGICTPGMIVSAVAILRAGGSGIEDGLAGVLCRCTGYAKILDAVRAAAAGPVHLPDDPDGRIGAPIPRLDARPKISGAEVFGDDIAPVDTLTVRIIRAPYARAAFAFGDLEAWINETPGIRAVLTSADIAGRNRFGVIPGFEDQPVFAETEARFPGEAVAAIVGEPMAISALDPAAFPVSWTPREPVLCPASAQVSAAPLVHADRPGNLMCEGHVRCGDADAALERADAVVSGTFTTPFVEHAYIEPEAGYATVEAGRVTIHASTQAPGMDRDALATILGLRTDRIRIVPSACGGGFGSKLDLSLQPYLALAALKVGLPVRMAYSRTESMQSTTKRHPATMHVSVGATRDGRLSGFRFRGDFDTGAYASWGPTVANRVPVHASGPYRIRDYLAKARAINTHNPPAGAFRGFGVPQAAIAQEVLFDALAERLGLDPLEFRQINALGNGDPTVCGQVFAQGVGIGACFAALRPAWDAAVAEDAVFNADAVSEGRPERRGTGLGAGWYGCGNTSIPNPSTIRAGITAAGEIVLHQGATDIGQGANTVIAQIFAEALGVPVSSLRLVGPDTDLTPDAGKTSASRQTFVSGNAARLCGLALRADILRRSNASEDARIEPISGGLRVHSPAATHEIGLRNLAEDRHGYVLVAEETYDPPTRPLDAAGQGVPYAQFGYAAHLARVAVDLDLGTVRPLGLVAAHDVGRAINPMLIEGQVEGGIAQGLGMALMEEYIPGRTENLHDYLIPTIGDVPPIETIIVEEPDAHGPYGAKGLGEHALIPTAPALLNAINRAAAIRLTAVPATPSRVRAAILAARDG